MAKKQKEEINKLIFLMPQIEENVSFSSPKFEDYTDNIPPPYFNETGVHIINKEMKARMEIKFIRDSCVFLSDFLNLIK